MATEINVQRLEAVSGGLLMAQLSALRGNPYRLGENMKVNTGSHFNNEENLVC